MDASHQTRTSGDAPVVMHIGHIERLKMMMNKNVCVTTNGQLHHAKVRLSAQVTLFSKCAVNLKLEGNELKVTASTLRMKDRGQLPTIDSIYSVLLAINLL